LPLAAELDEVRRLQRALRKEDAVVRDNPHRIAHQPRKSADQRRAIQRLELMEPAAIHQPRDNLAHVEALARVARHDAIPLPPISPGTYAPPALHEPITAAICGIPFADSCA